MTELEKATKKIPESRPYRTPNLFVYGDLRELTASGTGKAKEMGNPETAKLERP